MRVIDISQWGKSATSFNVIDDIFAGTVHQSMSDPVSILKCILGAPDASPHP